MQSPTSNAQPRICHRCGEHPRRHGQSWCAPCHARYTRENRPRHSELTDDQRKKANTRSYSNVLQKRGVLVPVPCRCGSIRVQKHHEDYSDPRTVFWACRPCHLLDHGFITQERWRQLHDADLGAAKN